mmetsp:Transcript_2856/g.4568  ORF Transcript_2856/g.4568 Transcript_2856/m.4568 type:complete len:103 (+) Transcript_2856:1906-2214(+)
MYTQCTRTYLTHTCFIPLRDFPDKSQQLRKGDRILTVDGESASSLDASQLATALHGSPGSLVAIRVARRVQYERQVSATRSSNGGVGLFFWSLSYCSPRLPF